MKTFNQIDGTNYLLLYLVDNDTYFTHGEYKQKKNIFHETNNQQLSKEYFRYFKIIINL